MTLSLTINQTLKWLSSLPILNYNAGVILVVTVYSDRSVISLFPHIYTHPPLLPVPNKPYGFCGCKAPCLLWWLAACGCNRYWNEVLFIWTLNGTRTDNGTTVNRYIFFLSRITLNGTRTDKGTTVNRYIFFLLPPTETTYSLFGTGEGGGLSTYAARFIDPSTAPTPFPLFFARHHKPRSAKELPLGKWPIHCGHLQMIYIYVFLSSLTMRFPKLQQGHRRDTSHVFGRHKSVPNEERDLTVQMTAWCYRSTCGKTKLCIDT